MHRTLHLSDHADAWYSQATASILNDLLKGPISSGKTTTFKDKLKGLNSDLAGAEWTGKTGTTDDYTDVWLILSTPKTTLGGLGWP